MSDRVGFVVEYVVWDSDTYFHVIGRCGDGTIYLGDEFDRILAPPELIGGVYGGLGAESSVNLRVERIQAYQHQLEELSGGMTGTLDLRGQGLNHVVPGAVLGIPVHATIEGHVRQPM